MIHQYKNNGYNIVLDVNSGSVHVVDDVVYDVIPVVEQALAEGVSEEEIQRRVLKECGGSYPEEEVQDALWQVMELKEAGDRKSVV